MFAESTEQDPSRSILKSSYAVEDYSMGSALYVNRFNNDELLMKVIQIAKQNNELNAKIEEFKASSPKFLNNWWESTVGAENMTTFLKKIEKNLNQQIDFMSDRIRRSKTQAQFSGLEVENKLEQQQSLINKKSELQHQLSLLIEKNNMREQELNYALSQRNNFSHTYKQLQSMKEVLQLQSTINNDHTLKINASLHNQSYQQTEKKYFEQLKTFFLYLIGRKHKIEESNAQSLRELEKINSLIEKFDAESKGIQLRKESIVRKHVELKQLRQELVACQQRRKEAAKKKCHLEKLYCEEEMEKLTSDYQELQSKCDNLVGKALNLAKDSIEHTKLRPLQKVINRQQMSE